METPAPPNSLVRAPSPNPTPIPPQGPGSQRPNRLEKHVPRSRWYTDADPIADEQRRAEARQLREAHEAELVGAEPREQRRLKELYRRASNELRQRHVAAVALENKAIDIRKRQKRRKELKPQLTDLFSARRVPPELIQNILAFIGYDLVQAPVEAQVIVRGIAASIHNMMQSQHGAAVLAATAAAGAAAFDASGSFSGVNIAAFDAALAAYEDGSSDQVAVNAEVVNDESSVDEDWDDDVDDDAPALDQVDVGAHVGGPPDHVAANAEVNARARERAMRHALRHAWAPGGMFRRLAEREWVDPAMALSRMESAWNPGGVYRMEVERYERSLP